MILKRTSKHWCGWIYAKIMWLKI